MMIKRITFVCAMMACAVLARGKDVKYPVSAIPAELRQNVNAVVREDETVFRIISRNSATVHFHYVVTIFNENEKSQAQKAIMYDKLIKVRNLEAAVYDAAGESIRKLKASDIRDQYAFDGVTLFSDNRVKFFDLTQGQYPYTVDIEYDIDYDFLFFIDGSVVANAEKISVEHFTYQLIYPVQLKPRYKAYNIDVQPVSTTAGPGIESLAWTLEKVPPLTIEPMTSLTRQLQYIQAAPGAFEFSGYSGDMSNWQQFGKWLKSLNEGRDKLPDETKRKVHELTDALGTSEEKAKVLYEYMQSRTRYVSVQLGIGGFQPFDATTVDRNGYGDCKALSNYMVALLKEAGVPALYTIISAGAESRKEDASFPYDFANHVIVTLPSETDTTWLECTSQTNPYGYIGTFTDNRYGLMVTEDGGRLTRTTHYKTEQNVQATRAEVTLDATGDAKAKIVSNYSGLQYEEGGLFFVLDNSREDQKNWIQKNLSIPNYNLNEFSLADRPDKIPTAVVTLDLTLNKYASVSNKRVFLTPNLMNRSSFIPPMMESRKTPFGFARGFTDIDTIRYYIPESIYPEFLPPNSKFESRFGSYEAGFKLDQGSLIYFRKMTRKDGEFPPEAYREFVEFYKNINKADNTKIVFLNKT